jgi:hypothetical protein
MQPLGVSLSIKSFARRSPPLKMASHQLLMHVVDAPGVGPASWQTLTPQPATSLDPVVGYGLRVAFPNLISIVLFSHSLLDMASRTIHGLSRHASANCISFTLREIRKSVECQLHCYPGPLADGSSDLSLQVACTALVPIIVGQQRLTKSYISHIPLASPVPLQLGILDVFCTTTVVSGTRPLPPLQPHTLSSTLFPNGYLFQRSIREGSRAHGLLVEPVAALLVDPKGRPFPWPSNLFVLCVSIPVALMQSQQLVPRTPYPSIFLTLSCPLSTHQVFVAFL